METQLLNRDVEIIGIFTMRNVVSDRFCCVLLDVVIYQEWGKEAQELRPGDVVVIPAGGKRWHGAAPDSWFAHLAVEVPGEKTSTEWCESVAGDIYSNL